MMAMTTNSSIKVNAARKAGGLDAPGAGHAPAFHETEEKDEWKGVCFIEVPRVASRAPSITRTLPLPLHPPKRVLDHAGSVSGMPVAR